MSSFILLGSLCKKNRITKIGVLLKLLMLPRGRCRVTGSDHRRNHNRVKLVAECRSDKIRKIQHLSAASSEWGCVRVCETIYRVSYYYRNLDSNLGIFSINQLSKEVGQLAMNTKVADWSIRAVEN